MSRERINPAWQEDIRKKLAAQQGIDVIQSFTPCIQWLIGELTRRDLPYKLYNLGAGVKRLTTDTDICPCCKQKL